MIGFDSDDVDVFQEQLDFFKEAKVSNVVPNKVGALPGTPLYERIKREGRLRSNDFVMNLFSTNIKPIGMSLRELNEGFAKMCEDLYTPEAFSDRCLGEIERLFRSPNRHSNYSMAVLYLSLGWVLLWYLFDPNRRKLLKLFLKLVPVGFYRYPKSIEIIAQRLVLYRHVCHVVVAIREGCKAEIAFSEWHESDQWRLSIPLYDT